MAHEDVITVQPSDFEMKYDAEHTFPFFEDEDANGVYGYGHQDKAAFASLVNEYDTLCDAGHDPVDDYIPDDVMHCYAVAYLPEGAPIGEWRMRWRDITSETPGAFLMTWLVR